MTTKAAEDFDFIAKRLKEIQEEKERARQQQEQESILGPNVVHLKDGATKYDPDPDDEFLGIFGVCGMTLEDRVARKIFEADIAFGLPVYENAFTECRDLYLAMARAAIDEVRREEKREWSGYD